MADISDVLDEMVTLVADAIYPSGTSGSSVAGMPVKVYPGWPVPNQLNADIAAGKAHVSIYPQPEERNTTRVMSKWQEASISDPTLTMTVDDDQVTVGGTVSVPQACMIVLNGEAYSYQVQSTDTLATIAAALAALITGATSADGVITCPGVVTLEARVITAGTAIMEIRRQERVIQLVIWAPTPGGRDNIAKVIDPALQAAKRMVMPDETYARLTYQGSPMTDMLSKSQIYRRDLLYVVEYATTQSETAYTIGHNVINRTLSPI